MMSEKPLSVCSDLSLAVAFGAALRHQGWMLDLSE